MPTMPEPDVPNYEIDDLYGGDFGNYDLESYLNYEEIPTLTDDYFGLGTGGGDEDPVMYFDQITTTTVPPDMYDYLFAFDKPSRNRVNGPVRKKFDAQALKSAYAALLKKSRARRVTRSIFTEVGELARQFLQKFSGPAPKVLGLLDRRAPLAFRQNSFVKISLSQFSIVSTGTTGKPDLIIFCQFRPSSFFSLNFFLFLFFASIFLVEHLLCQNA